MTKIPLKFSSLLILLFFSCALSSSLMAQEVDKGKIPNDQLAKSYKKLAWGVDVWDVDEAVEHLKNGENILWVDTRPESFFQKGTVRDAVLLVYNKKGLAENTLTAESLDKALADKGIAKDNATIVFFCQGPKCHRSYNASFAAVTDWGYSPERIVWFREGYPFLFKKIQSDAKLKRKAKRYISDDGVKQL